MSKISKIEETIFNKLNILKYHSEVIENNNLLLELIELLKNKDYNIDVMDIDGNSLIHLATEDRFIEILSFLISENAKLNIFNRVGYTPLILAVKNNQLKVTKYLIENGADIEASSLGEGNTALTFAIKMQNDKLVETLLSYNAKINILNNFGYSPLYDAVVNPKLSVIKILLKNEAEINFGKDFSNYPLFYICKNFSASPILYNKIFDLFMQNNANIKYNNDEDNSYLHLLCTDYNSILPKLLQLKPDLNVIDKMGNNALHIAVKHQNIDAIEKLINAGININHKNNAGNSALHTAVCTNDKLTIKYLLESGININELNNDGNSAILEAAINKYSNIIHTLLKAQADINIINLKNLTLIDIIIQNNDSSSLALINEFTNYFNRENIQNFMHLAYKAQFHQIFKLLSEIGDCLAEDNNDLLVIDIDYPVYHLIPNITLNIIAEDILVKSDM